MGYACLAYAWSLFEDYRIDLIGDQAICSIASIYTTGEWAAQVDVWGTEGILQMDLELMSLVRYRRDALTPWTVARSGVSVSAQRLRSLFGHGLHRLTGRFRSTHDILVHQLVNSIINDTLPPVSAEDGREAVRVMSLLADRLTDRRTSGEQ